MWFDCLEFQTAWARHIDSSWLYFGAPEVSALASGSVRMQLWWRQRAVVAVSEHFPGCRRPVRMRHRIDRSLATLNRPLERMIFVSIQVSSIKTSLLGAQA